MQKIKDEKGITLSVLIITIVVLSLLSVPVIVNVSNISSRQNYEDFCNDITKLVESVSQVYDLNVDFSTTDGYIGPKFSGDLTFLNNSQDGVNVKNPNDGDLYYVIDAVNLNKNSIAIRKFLYYGNIFLYTIKKWIIIRKLLKKFLKRKIEMII